MLLMVIRMTHFTKQIVRSSYSSLPRTGVEIYLFKNLITSLIAFQFIFLVGTRRTLNTRISLPHLYFLKKLLQMTTHKNKDNFLQWSHCLYISHLKADLMPSCRWPTQNKLIGIFGVCFVCCLLMLCLYFYIFPLLGLLLIYYIMVSDFVFFMVSVCVYVSCLLLFVCFI